ncbi:MAG: crotonase/enoyl-CoA hydratase family protein [Deltaproteobacteria bacterium]|nr:crotonase/enoyl-CoA hydratase family protein [Deltaproteobacteria bacterium]MBW1875169.1 crotonase/enoyl-CoA hydratase family protein [Deltaproteobacteria bacterium]MBW2210407.1 crotonase/enoyl-CoA hydratase family protein [Deltaproteobacteria bacterium]MBW2213928.1 crotonase/enoyl-CoA hydratase family protein [Deltaproteobacteria bacterium]MBW2378798.1 crotonase/enoyl-CoA hydratase family protein [Deltaproteobacteria bacterium]
MGKLVSYEHSEGIGTITMDDGKVNAMSVTMMQEINAALDQAEEDGAVVILTGRKGVFSAGFDLAVFKQGMEPLMEMLRVGARLTERLLSFPFPVVAACNGHGIAMGSFLLMSTDVRIGVDGPFRIGMNEVAIGMTLPYFAVEIARQRLTPAYFNRGTILAEMYSPQEAVSPGFLDRVVAADQLLVTARETAAALTKLDMPAHAATKLRVRGAALEALRQAITSEFG